jgi:hypothetical protein
MKKLFTLILLLSLFAANAQDTIKMGNWIMMGKVSFNFSQSSFTNWSAGGENSINGIGRYNMSLSYQKGKQNFTNWLDLALGYSVIGEANPMKTDDKIEYIPGYAYQLSKNWYFSVMGKFSSQFAKGYNYAVDSSTYISKFMAPGYVDLGPGFKYKPNDWFMLNLSPATAAWIIVGDQRLADLGSFGIDPAIRDDEGNIIQHADKSKFMFGAKLIAALNKEVAKNITLGTKLELFSDYLDTPQNIMVNWQVLVGLKVNKWLSVDLSTELLYNDNVMITDKDGNIGPRTQFKEMFMLSVGYAF